MKKKCTILWAFVIATAFLFTGCGKNLSESSYTGKWKGVSMESNGLEFDIADYFKSFYLELDEKGNAVVETNGKTQSGNWDEVENGIIIDKKLNFVDDDGKLKYTKDGVTVILEKQ